MSKAEEQPCEFPACAVHHICENPCKRNRTETLAKALADMADVDFDNVFLRSAAHLRALDASHQRLVEALTDLYRVAEVRRDEDYFAVTNAATALEQAKDLS